MRTLSAQETAVLASGRRSEHVRVRVDSDGLGTLQDLCDLDGRDWVRRWRVSESVDSALATATVHVQRELYYASLSPLMTGSKHNTGGTPMITAGRDIDISVAVLPEDQQPASGDWHVIFDGVIDSVDFGQDESVMSLVCRDAASEWQDEYVEDETAHPSSPPDSMENTIQEILNTHASSAPTLYTPAATSFNINEYEQQKEPILEAIRKIAQLIGWELRWRWDTGTSAWRLTLYEPDRSSPSVDRTFTAAEYLSLTRAAISRMDIRNKIRVVFTLASTAAVSISTVARAANIATVVTSATHGFGVGYKVSVNTQDDTFDNEQAVILSVPSTTSFTYSNSGGNQGATADTGDVTPEARQSVTVEDATSQTAFGLRFMELAEASTSQIDTLAEATTLANAALTDLKDPTMEQEASLPIYPWAQLHDYYTFAANGVHYDNAQSLGVTSIQHNGQRGTRGMRTRLGLRGSPSLGAARWIRNAALPGNAPSAKQEGPATPSLAAGNVTAIDDGFVVAWTRPTDPDWDVMEVHAKAGASSFVPDSTTLQEKVRGVQSTLRGLGRATQYTLRLVSVDRQENRSLASSAVTDTTLDRALGDLTGDLDDITDGTTYGKVVQTALASGKIDLSKDAGFDNKDLGHVADDPGGTWRRVASVDGSNQVATASIANLAVQTGKIANDAVDNTKIDFDQAYAAHTTAAPEATVASGNQDAVDFDTETLDNGSVYDAANAEFSASEAGPHVLSSAVTIGLAKSSTTNLNRATLILAKDTGGGYADEKVLGSAQEPDQTTGRDHVVSGSVLVSVSSASHKYRIELRNDGPDSLTIRSGAVESWFTGFRVY